MRLAIGFALMLAAGEASAQERLHFQELPDLKLAETTIWHTKDAQDYARFMGTIGVGGSTVRGLVDGPPRLIAPFASFGVGYFANPARFVQLYSSTVVYGGHESLKWSDLEGAHRARGRFGFGDLEDKKDAGVDLELDAALFHAAPYTTSMLRRDVPAYPFWDGKANLTVAPRLTNERDDAFRVPITYGARRLDFGAGGFTSERLSSGFGLAPYRADFAAGWLEIVGVSWEKARFDPRFPARLGGVEQIDLRAVHADGIIGSADRELTFMLRTMLGGSWVWDHHTRQSLGAFTFSFGMGMRGNLDRDKQGDYIGFGFAIARRAGFMADGSGLLTRWRGEANLEMRAMDTRLGGSVRYATEHLSMPLDQRDLGFRHVLATEWFYAPAKGLELGANHVATDRWMGTLAPTGEWSHTLGLFVRLTGKCGCEPKEDRKVPDEKPKVKDDPPLDD
jgi:hypothetical protein